MTGALAGAGHVLLGPEHLAALAPFSIDAGRRAWAIGLRWGIGHAAGIGIVGAAIWLLADYMDFQVLHDSGDYLIGVVLIAIGIWGWRHARSASAAEAFSGAPRDAHFHAGPALLVGGLHGAVGTGHLMGVLPTLGMESWVEAGTYFGGFAFGTVGSMVGFAALMGAAAPGDRAAAPRAYGFWLRIASAAALVIGVAWMVLPLFGITLLDH